MLYKLCVEKGILNKIKCYIPQSVLRNVYFGLAHPYLYYGVTSWRNAALICTHKIQVQLNYIVKIFTRTSFFKSRFSQLYIQLNPMKLKGIYELEVLKFVYKFTKNYLPKCFGNYFLPASKIYNYSTKFASE